jgi:hypothetical protein
MGNGAVSPVAPRLAPQSGLRPRFPFQRIRERSLNCAGWLAGLEMSTVGYRKLI